MRVERIGVVDQIMTLATPILKEPDPRKYPTAYAYVRWGLLFPIAFAAIAAGSSALSVLQESYGVGAAISNVILAAFSGIVPLVIFFIYGAIKDDSKLDELKDAQIFDELRENLLRHPVHSWVVKQELLVKEHDRTQGHAYCLYCEDENGRRFSEILMPVKVHHFGTLNARFTEEGWGPARGTA